MKKIASEVEMTIYESRSNTLHTCCKNKRFPKEFAVTTTMENFDKRKIQMKSFNR